MQLSKLTPQSPGEWIVVRRALSGEDLGSSDSDGQRGLRIAGAWSRLPDGSQIWRFRIHSPNAAAIRVHFEAFDVGRGRVWLCSGSQRYPDFVGHPDFVGPYSGTGPHGHGDFWSETVLSDSVIVEYLPESASRTSAFAPFVISGISHALSRPRDGTGDSY